MSHTYSHESNQTAVTLNTNISNSKQQRRKQLSPFILLVIQNLVFCIIILLLFGYYFGNHPSMAQQRNLPPILKPPAQNGSIIHLTWNTNNWYDKYNVHWVSNKRKEGQIDDIRNGEAYFEVTSSDIAYNFVVQGCVEDRFFDWTIHSTCTNWSGERRILLNPSAQCINGKWKWLYKSRYPLFKCDSS